MGGGDAGGEAVVGWQPGMFCFAIVHCRFSGELPPATDSSSHHAPHVGVIFLVQFPRAIKWVSHKKNAEK